MKRLFLCVLLAGLVVSGCGLPSDTSPREIALEEIPPELRPGQLPTPTPERAIGRDTSVDQIFMIGADNRLEPVERERSNTPDQIIETLLEGTFPEEAANGITTALSARLTQVRSVSVNELFQLATVDLAAGSLADTNSEQKFAFAQIVFSLTSLPNIELVEFVQTDPDNPDDEPASLAVQTDNGTTLPGKQVGRLDFDLVDPNTGPQIEFDLPTAVPTVETTPRTAETVWKVREVFMDEDGVEVVGEIDNLEAGQTATEPRLVGVVRLFEEVTPEAVVANLFTGTPLGERNLGIRSAFPPDALLNNISVTSYEAPRPDQSGVPVLQVVHIAEVDLAAGSLPSEENGRERLLAAAQVVFNFTGLDEVDEVVFSIDGQAIELPTDEGFADPFDPSNPRGLTRVDFASHAPGGNLWRPQPVPMLTPTPEPEPTPTPGG